MSQFCHKRDGPSKLTEIAAKQAGRGDWVHEPCNIVSLKGGLSKNLATKFFVRQKSKILISGEGGGGFNP